MKLQQLLTHQYLPIRISAAIAAGAAISPSLLQAQTAGPVSDTNPLSHGYLHRASGMLLTGNPLGSANQMAACADDYDGFTDDMKAEWLALEGASLFERNNPDCVDVLQQLVTEFPTYQKSTQALLTLGDWYWLHSDWHEAIEKYSKVDIKNLSAEQSHLYSYRKALAYLKCGVPENATPLLESIASDPEYAQAAKYYTAYIHYLQKDYDTAYDMMQELSQLKNISDGIEPLYYMAQIEYTRGQYKDVINHSKTLLGKNNVKELIPEINRIAGLSYFKTGDNVSARPLLEKFFAATDSPNDDATYALGAIQYSDGDIEEAEKNLRGLTDRNNDLAQGAYLYLGQIAEQRGDINAAAMAFNKAANMAYDTNVAETALYNHVVALTKGGNAPFSSSITMLEDFLKKYPDSRYSSEVQESLASAYFYENDYVKALASINRVKDPSQATLASKQKILYKLGTSEITSGNPTLAAEHLREAADMNHTDSSIADEARLWQGEALYATGDYRGAATAYSSAHRGNLTSANKIAARYGLAYSQFKMENWKEAQKNFSAITENRNSPDAMRGDALLREADCLLYMGDYKNAASIYQRATNEEGADTDYAAFRHAVTSGLTEGTDSKMKKLNAFLKDRPNSKWTAEVLLEAGKTMAALDMPDKAAPYFEKLSHSYPKDNKSRNGVLSLALAYMKQGEKEKAKNAYKDLIRTWPTSEEASLANDDMRRICAADGSLIDYAEFLSEIEGAPQIDPDEMDAITFEAAETAYAANQNNTKLLEQYVSKFPDGRYLANALMDLAEASDQEGDTSKTFIYLDRLLSARGDSPQVPSALFLKADLLESAGEREKALDAYLALEQRGGTEFAPEATAGVMRNTDDAKQRTTYARKLLSMGGVSAEDAEEARFYEASGLLHSSQSSDGEAALKILADSPNSISGAKAAVELGEWYLNKGDIENAHSILETFTDAGSVYSYWLARGFIALAEVYHSEGNDYLAVEYLKSLRDNYPGDEDDIAESIETKIRKYSTK